MADTPPIPDVESEPPDSAASLSDTAVTSSSMFTWRDSVLPGYVNVLFSTVAFTQILGYWWGFPGLS